MDLEKRGSCVTVGPFNDELSVVVPVHNEAGNIRPLIEEITAALSGALSSYEIIYVDDASNDASGAELAELRQAYPSLRVFRHRRQSGQSTAFLTGILNARYNWIATLDGDGQNNPADIPKLLARLTDAEQPAVAMLAGWRAERNDTWFRRFSSRIANGVRSSLLGDATPDTGCGLKVFERTLFLRLPYFDHMHRFLPALVQRAGGRVESVKVSHRSRVRGTSKYGLHNRLWVGIVDLVGVMWLLRRARLPGAEEL